MQLCSVHIDSEAKRESFVDGFGFFGWVVQISRHMDRAIFSTEIKPIGKQLSFYDGL